MVVLSTDHDYTLRYPAGTEVTVEPGVSRVMLPLTGAGAKALKRAAPR